MWIEERKIYPGGRLVPAITQTSNRVHSSTTHQPTALILSLNKNVETQEAFVWSGGWTFVDVVHGDISEEMQSAYSKEECMCRES